MWQVVGRSGIWQPMENVFRLAEVYSDASQAALRQQLTQLGDQIDLLQKSQNASATQLDTMRKERSSALYDLMDALDSGEYDETEKGTEEYLLA